MRRGNTNMFRVIPSEGIAPPPKSEVLALFDKAGNPIVLSSGPVSLAGIDFPLGAGYVSAIEGSTEDIPTGYRVVGTSVKFFGTLWKLAATNNDNIPFAILPNEVLPSVNGNGFGPNFVVPISVASVDDGRPSLANVYIWIDVDPNQSGLWLGHMANDEFPNEDLAISLDGVSYELNISA